MASSNNADNKSGMKHMRKNLIPRNEGFVCEACGEENPPAKSTSRNHCRVCLTSKHVDEYAPGDRLSTCGGLMPATGIEGSDPDKLVITHTCKKCGKTIHNKAAPDDDKDALFALFDAR